MTVVVPKREKRQNTQKIMNILEGALKVFGEIGYENATISDICRAAKISDATLYEYFDSKEEVLFSIPEEYTKREVERLKEIMPHIRGAKEKLWAIIKGYLVFYQENRLYTSVVLLTLKGNKRFLNAPAYRFVREASRGIVDVYNQGVSEGIFRDDIDGYLVRNMILGFIEHITIQWLLIGRPERITDYVDIIFDMMIRSIEKKKNEDYIEVRLKIDGS